MFDIGFWEITLIAVIALLVVGPDRLPGMVRTIGFWVGRIRRYVHQVRDDIEREINAEELKKTLAGQADGLEDLYEAVEETRGTLDNARESLEAAEREADERPASRSSGEERTEGPEDEAAPASQDWSRSVDSPAPVGPGAPPERSVEPVSAGAPDAQAAEAPAATPPEEPEEPEDERRPA